MSIQRIQMSDFALLASRIRSRLGLSALSVQPQVPLEIHAAGNATLTWTDMPSAETILGGGTTRIRKVDMTNFTQARLVSRVTVAGVSGSKLIVRYNTSGSVASTVTGNWTTDLGTTEISHVLTSTGMIDSGWINIASGAKGDYHIAIIGSGGDGVVDPAFGGITVWFR